MSRTPSDLLARLRDKSTRREALAELVASLRRTGILRETAEELGISKRTLMRILADDDGARKTLDGIPRKIGWVKGRKRG